MRNIGAQAPMFASYVDIVFGTVWSRIILVGGVHLRFREPPV